MLSGINKELANRTVNSTGGNDAKKMRRLLAGDV
jgi:hypothetical protein